jgi:hypothetical protein
MRRTGAGGRAVEQGVEADEAKRIEASQLNPVFGGPSAQREARP